MIWLLQACSFVCRTAVEVVTIAVVATSGDKPTPPVCIKINKKMPDPPLASHVNKLI